MSLDLLGDVLAAGAVLIGAISIALWRRSRSITAAWRALVAEQTRRIDQLHADITQLGVEVREARQMADKAEIAARPAKRRAERLGDLFDGAVGYIEALTAWVVAGAPPPPPPLPVDLVDHVRLPKESPW